MAKIVATFDTAAKTLTVTEDGKAVADVYCVNLCRGYRYRDDDGDEVETPYACEVTTMTEDPDEKLMRMTRLVASEDAALAPVEPKPDVSAAIAQFLARE
jgi:hypothetical protein